MLYGYHRKMQAHMPMQSCVYNAWHCSAACDHAADLRGCGGPSLLLLLYQHLLASCDQHCSAACNYAAHLRGGSSQSLLLLLLLHQHLLALQVLQQLLLLPLQEIKLQGGLLPLKLSQSLSVVIACIQASTAQVPALKGSPCNTYSMSRTCTA